jgi:hypothetical protein
MPCVFNNMVQCSLGSCCLCSHVEQPGAFEQPSRESLPELQPAEQAATSSIPLFEQPSQESLLMARAA